ncbi:MAG: SUMF1/EgtB/PvdO family nonheme iron enzyme, partial [Deltaproteobacteria bacterium]|nr:SUMF1/EgtB/PvdO family nonheme iron enzyme [Deltaproteobacteria bacterium]
MGTDRLRSLPLIALAIGLVTTACGAVAEDPAPAAPPPRSPPGFWPPDATDGPTPALLGDVLDVPAGFVRDGYWSYSDAKRSLFAAACDDPNPGVRTVRYRVAPFRMMRLEVTNRVYASCVAAGKCRPPNVDLSDDPFGPVPWDAPSRSERPVATSQIAARALCRAYGGDLPTFYQWLRAAEGDSGAFGIATLTETWIRCRLGEALELCEALRNATWQRVPTKAGGPGYFPIASTTEAPWDVGPYGHRALFG